MSELRHGNDILNPVVVINPVDDTKTTPQNTWSASKIEGTFNTQLPNGYDEEINIDTYSKNIKGWFNNLSGILPKNITAGWFENEYVNSSTINQKIITYDKEIFVRSMFGGVWSDWKEIVNTSMLSNPNLLDNPWFTVNQRGKTSYKIDSGAEYTVDRWRHNSGNTLTVTEDGVYHDTDASLWQPMPYKDLIGKTVTISLLREDGELITATGVIPEPTSSSKMYLIARSIDNKTNVNLNHPNNALTSGLTEFRIASNSVKVKAVKLELGSVSTLHLDTAPNYATELMKCKRYYQRIIGSAMYFSFVAGTNSSAVYFPFLLETEMRANPTIKCSVMPYIGEVSSGSTQATNQVTELTCSTKDFRLLEMKATTTSTVPNGIAKIYLKESNTTIEFSADL